MTEESEAAATGQGTSRDGLAAMAMVLLTVGLIALVVSSLL